MTGNAGQRPGRADHTEPGTESSDSLEERRWLALFRRSPRDRRCLQIRVDHSRYVLYVSEFVQDGQVRPEIGQAVHQSSTPFSPAFAIPFQRCAE